MHLPPRVVSFLILAALMNSATLVAAQNTAPSVPWVTATQLTGAGTVRIFYNVTDAENDTLVARLICSSDNGATFDLMPVSVSGDINKKMLQGTNKEILWQADRDYPGQAWSQVVAKVYVSDGPTLGGPMVRVAAGPFTMGSDGGNPESPAHTVTLDAFDIDKFEVTNAEYQRFMDFGGYTTRAFWSTDGWSWRTGGNVTQPAGWGASNIQSGPDYPGFPVVGVSWYEAEAYANFVGKRLPTEAEWEKAARGTDARIFPWGPTIDGSRANYTGSGDPYNGYSTPVGFFDGRFYPNPPFQTTNSPGPYGAYDQIGNVSEWVHDWYDANYYSVSPSTNPTGPLTATGWRGARGGDYNHDLNTCTNRWGQYPHTRDYAYGIRCARSVP